MGDATAMSNLPATKLRPLHSRRQISGLNNTTRLLESHHNTSRKLTSRSGTNVCITAFVRLVAQLVVLDSGESYCIQDSIRGGFILAQAFASTEDEKDAERETLTFVECPNNHDIPTDFSIGHGKALQLHIDEATQQVWLAANLAMIPEVALDALSYMLEDIMLGLYHGQGGQPKWSRPSALNFPPKHRPPPLLPSTAAKSDDDQIQQNKVCGSRPAFLHHWFELRASESPDRTALDYLTSLDGERNQYSYQQVNIAANRLAHELVRIASTLRPYPQPPIRTVAIHIGPCPELYISYLASLKAGFAFCPIPVDAPKKRKEALIDDLQPVALLVAPSTHAALPTSGFCANVEVVDVAPYLTSRELQSETDLAGPKHVASVSENDVAYILYTSGTSGRPKGVVVSHISAACTVSALSAHYGFVPPSSQLNSPPWRWFQGAAPTFDISIFEIFWTLSTGSTLCCAPRELTLQDPDKVITTFDANLTNVTPSFASLLDPSSICGLMVGGETLNTRLLQDFARYNPGNSNGGDGYAPRGIYNGYGPTETAIYCIAQAHIPKHQRGSVIGTPIATCGALIVNERMWTQTSSRSLELVPIGATGELVITGPQVSRIGYLNRPDETTRAFLDDPHWGRSYRTGDRARVVWDACGQPLIEFLGRISDDQVKLSGRRVELGEIESVLASKVDGVREALCCIWKQVESETGSEKVVSLVVLEKSPDLDPDVVRQRCEEATRQHLPDYMTPFRIINVDTLPRSASGKADRKVASAYVRDLMKADHEMQQSGNFRNGSNGKVGPLTNSRDVRLEQELLEIVSRILNEAQDTTNPTITATMPLADFGMDSLRAMRFLRDLRKTWPDTGFPSHERPHRPIQPSLALLLDSQASVRSVFFPSVQDVDLPNKLRIKEAVTRTRLADFAFRHMSEALDKLHLAEEGDIETILPATCTQSQLAMSFALNSRNYISHSILRLNSNVCAEALKEAIQFVFSEQPIYRCAMLPCDDSLSPFAQIILTPEAWQRFPESKDRVVHKKSSVESITGDARIWLDAAEENMNLDLHRLYHVQIIESDSEMDFDMDSAGLLIISVAHCICDGASLEVLMSDIARQYAGMKTIPRQGIHEAVLDWASNVNMEIDKLWKDSLKDWEAESFGSLSGKNVGSSALSLDRGHETVQLTSDLQWHILESRSRALGGSPLSVLQSSWSLLLHLFSEADSGDITFGSVVAGHDLPTHAPTFSVLPCRVDLPRAQTIRQIVDYLTSRSRFTQTHRHTSFGLFKTMPYNTVLALQAYFPPGSKSNTESEEIVPFPWIRISTPAIRYDFDIFAEVFPRGPQLPGQAGQSDNVIFKLTYREDAMSKMSATCIAQQFAALTELMLSSSPHDLVQGLPSLLPRVLLSAEGLLPLSNGHRDEGHQQNDPRRELLHSQFEDQVLSTPDLLALSFYTALDMPPIELSYAELDARANGLANVLREEDVEIIPICLQRGVELYVAVLAILKAGSAWCPIDDTSPVERRSSLIARTHSKIVLTTTESFYLVKPCLAHESLRGLRVLLVDQYATQSTSLRANPRQGFTSTHELGRQDLAYLLWTSGTTGEPKGVMVQHGAATQAMRDLQIQVKHDKNSKVRTLQLSAYSFDVFVQDLFYTWGLSGSVISGTRELVLGTFTDFIWRSRPTHAHLTPSFGASINVDEIRGSTLQYVTFIGEKLTEGVAEAWAAPEITTCAYNTYGPAENAVVSTMRQFYGKSRDKAKAANVGFPLTPCTAYVVREIEVPHDNKTRWELVPRYGVGELALGGAQVAKGYLGNEAKTAKTFIQGVSGIDERIYLTGDMVRLNDHGFEFLGRNDDLVKITGIRIELSEISAVCARVKDEVPSIEHIETLHLLRPGADSDSSSKIVVTFVSIKNQLVDTDKIRAQIFQMALDLLPVYMVPGHVVVLDTSMPRTASNKVDRKALQEIYKNSDLSSLAGSFRTQQSSSDSHHTVSNWNEEQLHVLAIIATNFKVAVEPLRPEDSLAGLGFGSLQITKLAWSLRRQLKCEVGVIDLMRCQLLGELVEVVLSKLPMQERGSSEAVGTAPEWRPTEISWVAPIKTMLTNSLQGDMRPLDTVYVLPATPMQESLIIETMLEPGAYWSHRVFNLSHLGEISARRLEKAWIAAATRFDILRTVFVPLTQLQLKATNEQENVMTWARAHGVQSTVVQLVRKHSILRWTCLSGDEDGDEDLARWAEKLQVDLAPASATRPPWAVTVVERNSKMMLSMHHALHDNVASGIILDTVAKLYQEQDNDTGSTIQLERGLELGILPTIPQRDEAFSVWNKRLAELRTTVGSLNAPFPDLTQSRQKQPQRILVSRMKIPSTISESGSALVAVPTLFQSAFGCILASYLELRAVMFGQAVSQRILHPDLDRMVGPAIATLPVVVRADASSSQELWNEMSRDSLHLFRSTQYLHPVDIKKMLNEGTGSSNAPFPGLFVYHPAPEGIEDAQTDGSQIVFHEVDEALSLNVEHPLAFNVFESDGTVELSGNGRLISQAHLELMLNQILDQARVMLDSPELPLSQLRNKMNRNLIAISGETMTDANRMSDPTESVSLHAAHHPDWIAAEEVSFQDSNTDEDEITSKSVTYAQLNMLTDAVVCKLASHEAKLQSDDIVALYMSRDIRSLAATLAIFRAGYVYLPIDEDLPQSRKQLLIKDAGAKLIVTTEELYADLELHSKSSPPALLIPDGEDHIDKILTWSVTQAQHGSGQGGYLLYTSGSTGRPKGVRVSNNSLCHFIGSFSSCMIEASPVSANLGGTGRYLNLASRAFDPHLTQVFVPWHLGYRVVIGRDRKTMLGSLQQVINELEITHFGSVPSVLTQLRLVPEDVPSVRVVTTGGEKASSELLNTWSKGNNSTDRSGEERQVVLFNFYGPTEVTIGCFGQAVNQDSNARNLGLPLRGLEALLLCPGTGDQQVVAMRGEPGELCIAGPQVAMGYLDRPVENVKSFVTTSLLGGSEKRIYKTGDVMRMMHDGTVEFFGRADQQVKIRGQRLELDEVVSFLKGAAAGEGDLDFAATVVATRDHGSDEQQQLFGFMARSARSLLKGEVDAEPEVLRNTSSPLSSILERLEQKCATGLPSFMVPTMLWVSQIPYQAAAGKIDTKLLTKLANEFLTSQQAQGDIETSSSSPATDESHTLGPAESTVVTAVEEAVHSTVNATSSSSIHQLGIDSLSAVHLVSILKRKGFSELRMADILSSSCTVGSVARMADSKLISSASISQSSSVSSFEKMEQPRAERLDVSDLGLLPTGLQDSRIEAILPCLPLQSALIARSLLWLSTTKHGWQDSAADVPYVTRFSYRLSLGTSLSRWKSAVERVVASEAMLRTCFIQSDDDGRIFQVVLRASPNSPFEDYKSSADIVAQMNVRPPFSVEVGGTEQSGSIIVSLTIHHALFDGMALDIFRERVQHAYNGQDSKSVSKNDSINLLTSISMHCHSSNAQIESMKCSWQAKLHGVRPCRVESTNGTGRHGNMNRATIDLSLTIPDLKTKLQTSSSGSDIIVSVSSILQMATAVSVAQLTHQTSVVYGIVKSLRPLLDHIADGVETFIGPCLNTLVQTFSVHDMHEKLIDLAQRMQKAHLDICQGEMPLVSVEQVQRWAKSEDKLFDTLLNINVVFASASDNGELGPGGMIALQTRSKSDMALAIDVDLHPDGKIKLMLSSAGILTEPQLIDVGQLFEKVVCGCTESNTRVADFISFRDNANGVSPDDDELSRSLVPDDSPADEELDDAFSCLRTAICHVLRLEISELSSKPKTATLYQTGLDSITILPLVKHINKSENIKLTPDVMIKARTLEGAASLVREAKHKIEATMSDNGVQKIDAKHGGTQDGTNSQDTYDEILKELAKDVMFVATPLQESMLSASLAMETKAYTYIHTIQLSEYALNRDNASLDNFFAAVRDTVQACEILRTCFVFTRSDETPWAGVVSHNNQSDLINWEVADLDRPGQIRLRIHHALYDADSIRAVWSILKGKYWRRLHHDDYSDQGPSEYLFRPFARTVAVAQTASVGFWTNLIRNYKYTPLDFPDESLQAASTCQFALDTKNLSLLQQRCKQLGVTIKAALQLAWVKVLCEHLHRQADVVYGDVVSSSGTLNNPIVGPTINTVPMRVCLTETQTSISMGDALVRVQRLIDDARGINSMASLRAIQSSWRFPNSVHQALPASLFQSLFAFDGVADSANPADHDSEESLFRSVQTETRLEDSEEDFNDGPAYDDYPLVVSFQIKNNCLRGKLRTKLPPRETKNIGTQLEHAVKHVLSCNLQRPACDLKHMKVKQREPILSETVKNGFIDGGMDGNQAQNADAVLEVVRTVLGTRSKDKKISHNTRLINVGLDSILAIRLSRLLKKQLGINASVFNIIKGASVNDIAKSTTSSHTTLKQDPTPISSMHNKRLEDTAAKQLGAPGVSIKSVVPVLAGQRMHLEQWLYNGKRFFEAPWVYQVTDNSMDAQRLLSCWTELCRVHDILRTTFVFTSTIDLVQVTLGEQWNVKKQFTIVQDISKPIKALINEQVAKENDKPSDFREPPARCSFLEGSGGKAVVLRMHHALYDAWSIKMIERDLNELLASRKVSQVFTPFENVVRQIKIIRQPDAENSFWRRHLTKAQDTVLCASTTTNVRETPADISPLGPHFKASFPNTITQTTIDSLPKSKGNTFTSAVLLLAYSKTLGHSTNRPRPTFGLNHASRSLSSSDGLNTLDLTVASIPTLTVTPFCVNLEDDNSKSSLITQLDFIQDHLAQLSKYAQADDLHKLAPRLNSYLNIIYASGTTSTETTNEQVKPLKRFKLDDHLASSYFTTTKPSSSVISTIEGLETTHLCPHRLFFNVIVRAGQGVDVTVSGDDALRAGDRELVERFVERFGRDLTGIIKEVRKCWQREE